MAKGWLAAIDGSSALKSRLVIAGLVDINRAAAERTAAEFGLTDAAIGTDVDKMLDAIKPDMVFDDVISPAGRHAW